MSEVCLAMLHCVGALVVFPVRVRVHLCVRALYLLHSHIRAHALDVPHAAVACSLALTRSAQML